MLIGYNQATTLKNSNVETDLKYAEKYGYSYIEFQKSQLYDYLKDHSMDDLNSILSTMNIRPYAFNAMEYFNLKKDKEFEEVKEEFTKMCKISKEMGAGVIIIVPSPKIEGMSVEDVKKDSIESVNVLADIGAEYGIKLAYEYLGDQNCSVNTFAQCYDIIEAVDRDNVGIVLDCFHFYANGSKIEDLRKAKADKLFVFHINDCIDLPLGELEDSDRVWPGEGVIPLDKIFDALKSIGFDGVATIELFNPEYWKWEPEETIKVAKQKTEEVIKKYFG